MSVGRVSSVLYAEPVTGADELREAGESDLRIGAQERAAAITTLDTHREDGRLDTVEYDKRVVACQQAITQADLLRVFADLPDPHPELPARPGSDDDNVPLGAAAGCVTLLFGLPVTIVLGFIYGAWWGIAVPVAVTAAGLYIEHLRHRPTHDHRALDPPRFDG